VLNVFIASKKGKCNNSRDALHLFLRAFAPTFRYKLGSFIDVGAKIFRA